MGAARSHVISEWRCHTQQNKYLYLVDDRQYSSVLLHRPEMRNMEVADPDAPNRTLFNHCLQTLPCRSTSIGSVESSSVLARMMYQYRIQVIQSEPCQRASRPLFHFNHAARISFEAGRDLGRDVNLLTGYRGRSNRFADSFLVHIYWSSVDPAIACRQFTLHVLDALRTFHLVGTEYNTYVTGDRAGEHNFSDVATTQPKAPRRTSSPSELSPIGYWDARVPEEVRASHQRQITPL
jgi:hypothetical protein